MDFKEYSVENFLMNDSFRSYCLRKDEEDVRFWTEWIANNPEKRETVQQAGELFRLLNGNISSRQYMRDEAAFEKAVTDYINNTAQPEVEAGRPSLLKYLLTGGAGVAAAVLLFLFLLPKQPPAAPSGKYEIVQTSNRGERKSFQLMDGTKVNLNAGSHIKVARNFNKKRREVYLEGEAYFDVASNAKKPFIIHTSSMELKVLGTAFNVKAYAGERTEETSLISGLVEITLNTAAQEKVILHPNEKIVISLSQDSVAAYRVTGKPGAGLQKSYKITDLPHSTNKSPDELAWTENRLAFNSNSFAEIALMLERWYNVKIILEDTAIKSYFFTGTFDKKSITQVLEALQMSRPFAYTVKNNTYIIKKANKP